MAELKVQIDFDKFYEYIDEFKRNNPDFIEVVRCKDCKWHDRTECCNCKYMNDFVEDNDYCSFGERRKEE